MHNSCVKSRKCAFVFYSCVNQTAMMAFYADMTHLFTIVVVFPSEPEPQYDDENEDDLSLFLEPVSDIQSG